ncbi:hypothetical protein TSAR_009279 [Trichomalopsis sarcophagae]|uniref:SOCS box domain-containing protein n=1 Tax=Trichomalopsis sarcophagae TaxID=543379 RepID=A0A232FDG3_9HYME|nr:hypothetical protein TSAR_009279 [Trichomalopsis sarcophagae]
MTIYGCLLTTPTINVYYEINFHIQNRNSKAALAMLKEHPLQSRFYDGDGLTHLHIAVSKGLTDVAIYLMKQGCNVNFADCEGNTALTLAMQNLPFERDTECIYYLLYYGGNLAQKNKEGLNALGIFAERNLFRKKNIHHALLLAIKSCKLSDIKIAELLHDAKWPISAVLDIQKPNVISIMEEMDDNARRRILPSQTMSSFNTPRSQYRRPQRH